MGAEVEQKLPKNNISRIYFLSLFFQKQTRAGTKPNYVAKRALRVLWK